MSLQQFAPTPKLAEYSERFKDFFHFTRRADGVLLVEAHTNGGPIQLSVENHVAKKKAVHGESHIRNTVDYVREGRKNNFD